MSQKYESIECPQPAHVDEGQHVGVNVEDVKDSIALTGVGWASERINRTNERKCLLRQQVAGYLVSDLTPLPLFERLVVLTFRISFWYSSAKGARPKTRLRLVLVLDCYVSSAGNQREMRRTGFRWFGRDSRFLRGWL